MKQFLFMRRCGSHYQLELTRVGKYRLVWSRDRRKLNESGQHNLDYWKKMGVIVNEEENQVNG